MATNVTALTGLIRLGREREPLQRGGVAGQWELRSAISGQTKIRPFANRLHNIDACSVSVLRPEDWNSSRQGPMGTAMNDRICHASQFV